MNSENCGTAEAETEDRHDRPAFPVIGLLGMVGGVGAMTALTFWARFETSPPGALLWLDLAAGVLGCLLVPVLLWRPVPTALVLLVLAVLSPTATPAATLGALQVAQRRPFPVAVAVGAAGIASHAVQGMWRPNRGISLGWWLVLITAGYGALIGWGALARARRALLVSLRERARRAEAEQGRRVAEARMLERTRIAREMHDVLAHRLSLVATYAGALEYRPDAPPERLSQAAGVVRAGVHQALDELRDVIILLRGDDSAGDGQDAGGRPQPVLADLPRLVEESRDAGGRVRLRDEVVDPAALPPAAGRTAYRVVQEGLTNARKHAAGRPVQVVLEGRPGARLVIEIRNPLPADRAAPPAAPGSGTGLVGLTERVQLAGGRLDHEVAAGEFRLHAWIPWPA
ncbi:sensor histidine kinase [Actinomadura xylanilytica]|uniref:sensor histidine kinase n=1 Tax=Actinomadura xylanilytica TaxID=887459 RepID=UPI00255A8868|nr:histidine kinase [Actinomadura xylanilytica]MDL4776674.1 histidine kinase [Actinomadura xylanilytica]